MKSSLFPALAALGALATACAQTQPRSTAPAAPATGAAASTIPATPIAAAPAATETPAAAPDELAVLQDELRRTETEYREALKRRQSDAESTPEPTAAYLEKTRGILARGEALAGREPGSDLCIRTLIWLSTAQLDVEARTAALDRLLSEHMRSESLAGLPEALRPATQPGAVAALQRLAEDSPHATVRGRAVYALAAILRQEAAGVRKLRAGDPGATNQEPKRAAELARSASSDPDAIDGQADALLERVVRDYAEVTDSRGRKLGPRAEGQLFEKRNLLVGKVAPDIEGEDIHGERFKLTDYRGKVVVLDFWGHW